MLLLALSILVGLYVLGVIFVLLYIHAHSELGISYKDAFNPRKWLSFVTGMFLMELIPPHIVEQLVLRLYDDECGKICVKQGYCHDCGCKMPAKAYDPTAYCSKFNWGSMILDKKEYKEFRKKYPVSITVKYE